MTPCPRAVVTECVCISDSFCCPLNVPPVQLKCDTTARYHFNSACTYISLNCSTFAELKAQRRYLFHFSQHNTRRTVPWTGDTDWTARQINIVTLSCQLTIQLPHVIVAWGFGPLRWSCWWDLLRWDYLRSMDRSTIPEVKALAIYNIETIKWSKSRRALY